MLFRTVMITVALMFTSSQGFAKKSYEKGYGMAGCGLWSSLVDGKDKGSQLAVFALRTFVLNSQTTAISSQLSNCVEGASEYAEMEQEVFIEINLAELSKEASQGKGDHLAALSEVLGCQDQKEFARLSQEKFAKIYGASNSKAVLAGYASEIQSNDALTCSRLI